jgi:hypothetical protein
MAGHARHEPVNFARPSKVERFLHAFNCSLRQAAAKPSPVKLSPAKPSPNGNAIRGTRRLLDIVVDRYKFETAPAPEDSNGRTN